MKFELYRLKGGARSPHSAQRPAPVHFTNKLFFYLLSLKDPDRKPLRDTLFVGAACLPCSVWQRIMSALTVAQSTFVVSIGDPFPSQDALYST